MCLRCFPIIVGIIVVFSIAIVLSTLIPDSSLAMLLRYLTAVLESFMVPMIHNRADWYKELSKVALKHLSWMFEIKMHRSEIAAKPGALYVFNQPHYCNWKTIVSSACLTLISPRHKIVVDDYGVLPGIRSSDHVIRINAFKKGNFNLLRDQMRSCLHQGIDVIAYAEGNNAVKYRVPGTDPFCLQEFKSGIFSIAEELDGCECVPCLISPVIRFIRKAPIEIYIGPVFKGTDLLKRTHTFMQKVLNEWKQN